jgi:hypothetical protein
MRWSPTPWQQTRARPLRRPIGASGSAPCFCGRAKTDESKPPSAGRSDDVEATFLFRFHAMVQPTGVNPISRQRAALAQDRNRRNRYRRFRPLADLHRIAHVALGGAQSMGGSFVFVGIFSVISIVVSALGDLVHRKGTRSWLQAALDPRLPVRICRLSHRYKLLERSVSSVRNTDSRAHDLEDRQWWPRAENALSSRGRRGGREVSLPKHHPTKSTSGWL